MEKQDFSLRDNGLAQKVNTKQICLKSNELCKQSKVVCNDMSKYFGLYAKEESVRVIKEGKQNQVAYSTVGFIRKATQQPDGKIVLAVTAQEPCEWRLLVHFSFCYNSAGQQARIVGALVRLRSDGILDTTLGGAYSTETGHSVHGKLDSRSVATRGLFFTPDLPV